MDTPIAYERKLPQDDVFTNHCFTRPEESRRRREIFLDRPLCKALLMSAAAVCDKKVGNDHLLDGYSWGIFTFIVQEDFVTNVIISTHLLQEEEDERVREINSLYKPIKYGMFTGKTPWWKKVFCLGRLPELLVTGRVINRPTAHQPIFYPRHNQAVFCSSFTYPAFKVEGVTAKRCPSYIQAKFNKLHYTCMHPMYDYEAKTLLTYTFLHSKLIRRTKIWFYSFGGAGSADPEPIKYVINDRIALHMFGFTKRYYVLFASALEAKMSLVPCGTPILRALDDDYCGDLVIHFIPRPGVDANPFSINTKQTGFVYHSINCYDRPDGSIVVDAYVSKLNPSREAAQFELGGGRPTFDNEGDPFRFVISPDGTVESRLICSQMDSSIDFHCINPLHNGKSYENWWMIAHRRNRDREGVIEGIESIMYRIRVPSLLPLEFDPETTVANTRVWSNTYLRTPNFIPYAGSTAEDDGLLFCWAYERVDRVLDAKLLVLTSSLEVIRTLTLDVQIPYSVHSYVHLFLDSIEEETF
jgi:hypothetical protein